MYYGLNASAAWIWNRLSAAGTLSVETLVAELVREFDVEPSVAERDVLEFAAALRDSRLADARR
jgi:hypothetical protein